MMLGYLQNIASYHQVSVFLNDILYILEKRTFFNKYYHSFYLLTPVVMMSAAFENFNVINSSKGLIRQYFTKRKSFKNITDDEVAAVMNNLNHPPSKNTQI